ncbi:MAG: hypothetical protein AB7E05_11515 [Sphingobium sp.]
MMHGADPRPALFRGASFPKALFCGLILLALARYGMEAFAGPAWTIADDARQFLSWTARIADPAAMPGNFLADYWQQTAPPLYRGLLYGASALGIGPVLLSKLLAFPLIMACAGLAWRFARCFTVDPSRQLFAALCIMAAILHNDSIFSGTPRAFASPLILMTLLGMATRRHDLSIAGLLMSSIVYPAPAITGLGIFALHLLNWRWPLRLDLRWRPIALLGTTALLVLGAGLFFRAGLGDWGPTLRLQEVGQVFSLATPDGRSKIVGPDGHIAWICSPRIGFLPAIVHCQGNADPRLLVNALLTLVPMIGLWIAYVRKRRQTGQGRAGQLRNEPARNEPTGGETDTAWRLFPYSLAAALVCYVFTAMLAFTFHLPARYSQPILLIMGSCALGLWLGGLWNYMADRLGHSGAVFRLAACGAAVIALALFATPKTRLTHPDNPDLIALIASTPPTTRIAGIADDLSAVPAQTGRAILASTEHDIPYHRRYHRENQAGLRASMMMGDLRHPARIATDVQRYGVGLLVFDRRFLETGVLPESYRATMPPPHRIVPSADGVAAIRKASCRVVETPQWVAIFTSCLSGS